MINNHRICVEAVGTSGRREPVQPCRQTIFGGDNARAFCLNPAELDGANHVSAAVQGFAASVVAHL